MTFTYETQGTSTYLVYEVSAEDQLDTMSLGMITNNKIPGLAATVFTQMNTTKYIKYNITARISVSQFFKGTVNKKRLVSVFSGIINAILAAEEYMIDIQSMILDLNYIFVDVSTCDTVMVCLPLANLQPVETDLGAFFKNIMFSTQFDQSENCDYVAKIISILNSTASFSIEDFKAVLDQISGGMSQGAGQSVGSSPANMYQSGSVAAMRGNQNTAGSPVYGPASPLSGSSVQPSVNPPGGHRYPPQQGYENMNHTPQQAKMVGGRQPQQAQMNGGGFAVSGRDGGSLQAQMNGRRQPQQAQMNGGMFAVPGRDGGSQPAQMVSGRQPQQAQMNGGMFAVPGRDDGSQPIQMSGEMAADEKPVSFFYLLQHYNKENAQKYKDQKEVRKSSGGKEKNKVKEKEKGKEKVKDKGKEKGKKKASDRRGAQGFEVPGGAQGYGVPGSAQGFEVPGGAQGYGVPGSAQGFEVPGGAQGYGIPGRAQGFQVPGGAGVMPPAGGRGQAYGENQRGYQVSGQVRAPESPGSIEQVQNLDFTSPARRANSGVVQSVPVSGANFGDTNYYSSGDLDSDATVSFEETTSGGALSPFLIYKKNGERIPINKDVFYIGRDAGFNDYVINDNRYIGHCHCHLITRNGEYYIADDHSKNHTSVDGERIPAGVEIKLRHGQKISLADEEFEFVLM